MDNARTLKVLLQFIMLFDLYVKKLIGPGNYIDSKTYNFFITFFHPRIWREP
jgi:hypothetical protein